VMPFRLSLN